MSSDSHDALASLLALPGTRARLDIADWTRTVTCWPPEPGDAVGVDLRVDVRDVAVLPGTRGRLRRPDRRGLAVLDVEVVTAERRWVLLRALDVAVVQRRRHTRAETGLARMRPAGTDGGGSNGTGRLPLLRLLDLSESGLRVVVPLDPPPVGTAVDVQLVLGHEQELSDLVVVRGVVRRHDPSSDGTVVAVHLDERPPGRSPDRIRAAVLRAQGAARRTKERT